MIDLTNKHLLVFGGSRGIGAATARLAAKAGAKVSVSYVRDTAKAKAVVDAIGAKQAAAFQGDLAEDGVAKQVVTQAEQAFGPVHGVVVTAGIFEPSPIDSMTAAFWDRTMAINVRATFLSVQAAAPSLRKAGGGSVVIFTSTAGQRGSSVYSAYATSKGAQILFMRSMALELAPDRIRCNCVAPGWTDTDMASSALSEQDKLDVGKTIPLGRIGKPEDTAHAALFLLSDLACFITGSTVTVDGGFDMRG